MRVTCSCRHRVASSRCAAMFANLPGKTLPSDYLAPGVTPGYEAVTSRIVRFSGTSRVLENDCVT